MNTKTFAAPVLAATLLAPMAMPAANAAPVQAAPVHQGAVQTFGGFDLNQVKDALKQVNARINELRVLNATTPTEDYTQQINDLIDIAFDIQATITAFQTGGIGAYDLNTILPRIELATTMADVIAQATTNLQNKVSAAHTELALATTKSVFVLISPLSSVGTLQAEAAKLQALYVQVSGYRDLQDHDRATIYTKAGLDRVIWDTRFKRDRNVLGKTDFMTYVKLNRAITAAVGVWGDVNATVGDVKQAKADLNAAYEEAVSKAKS